MLAFHIGLDLTEHQRRWWASLIADAADEAGLPADPEFRSAFVAYVELGHELFHAGTLPVPARQLATGTILVDPPVVETGVVVAYRRVSSHERKADLERQAGRVLTIRRAGAAVVAIENEPDTAPGDSS